MTPADVRSRFRGVFGFPITPFHKDLSLDLDALARNVDRNVPTSLLRAGRGRRHRRAVLADCCGDRRRGARDRRSRHRAACRLSPAWVSMRLWAPRSLAAPRGPARIACWLLPPLLFERAGRGPVRLLRSHRPRQRPAAHDLQPRLGSILSANGGATGRARADACGVERRPGRCPQIPAHHELRGRSTGLARRNWGRLRARVFRHRRAGLHFEHLEHSAQGCRCSWPKPDWRGTSRGSTT